MVLKGIQKNKIRQDFSLAFLNFIYGIIPYSQREITENILVGFVYKSSSVISFTTLLAAWSAGKGFYALAEGFHSVLHINETRNYVYLRFKCLLYSVAFSIIISILFILGVFGKTIQDILLKHYPMYFDYTYLITGVRVSFIVFMLLILIYLLISFLPDWKSYVENGNKKVRAKIRLFCSLISSFVIYIYTVVFSLATNFFMDTSNWYGSIGALVSVMLWLYWSMYIIILSLRLSIFLDKSSK